MRYRTTNHQGDAMTNTTTIDFDKIEGITLTDGHHNIEATGTGCAMDAIAWAATGEITDMPSCVHPVLAKKVRALNDAERCTNADRWRLVRDGGPILVGSSEWEAKRACLVIADAGRTVDGFLSALRYAADLRSADLRFADLSSANLRSADLSSDNLRSARFDRLTVWPDGFDAAAAGAAEKTP